MDNALTAVILVASTLYLHAASGAVYGERGAARVVKSVVLAVAVGVIVVGYRFVILLVTLYST
jgi:hypothetical protein